jgi:lactoylglutathione lyase
MMRIDHIAILCKDLKGMKKFFMDYFDAVPFPEHVSKRTGQTNCFLSFPDGGSRLELMTLPEQSSQEESAGYQILAHISVSVGNRQQVDKMTKKLSDNGFRVLSGPRTTGDGYYESCVSVLEGLQIEITE